MAIYKLNKTRRNKMKVSELIAVLEKVQAAEGDILICVKEHGFGGYNVSTMTASADSFDEISPADCEEEPDRPTATELWPDWDGEEETIDSIPPVKVLLLHTGLIIYST
jgi:hypothetical protein